MSHVLRCSSYELVKTGIVEDPATTVLDSLDLSDGTCAFLSSGSEAVEFGVQVARRLTGVTSA